MRTEKHGLVLAHCLLHRIRRHALSLPILDRCALVVVLFAFGEADFEFDSAF